MRHPARHLCHRLLLLVFLLSWAAPLLRAAEVMPPAPANYFSDYAGVVSRAVAQELDGRLRQFERDTSNQFLVAIFPKMQSDSSVEDYTVRIAQSWRAGQKGRDNGVILFVFTQDRQLYIQVGYGLEGSLPDILCKRIIDNEIVPRLRSGDFNSGLRAGVEAVIAATRGEYKGTGRTATDGPGGASISGAAVIFFIILWVVLLLLARRGYGYSSGTAGWLTGAALGSFSRGGFSSGGFGGGFGGGGGFSGGGGSFGGGGAGGGW